MTQFYEDRKTEKRERLFMEFNSLSVVYGRPSETFLKESALKQHLAAEKKYYPKERGFKTSDQDKILQNEEPEQTKIEEPMDLLNMDTNPGAATSNNNDLLGGSNDMMDLLSAPTNVAQNTGGLLDTNQIPQNNTNDLLGGQQTMP